MDKKTSVGILGCGGWGITLALLLESKGCRISLWEPVEKTFKLIKERRENRVHFPGYKIPPSINITDSMEEALDRCDYIIVTVRSSFLRESAEKLGKIYNGQPIIIGTKGIEISTGNRMSEILAQEVGRGASLSVLSGPTIANELASGMPAAAVIASRNETVAKKVQSLLGCETLRLYTSSDVKGVETGGAFKNVLAIGAGIIDGLGLGINTKSSYLTRGINEMVAIGCGMGGRRKTFYGLSGIGDLMTTSFSLHSRNRAFGEGIAKLGKESYLASENKVIEGYPATRAFRRKAANYGIELPITESIYRIIYLDKQPVQEIKKLMTRRPKEE